LLNIPFGIEEELMENLVNYILSQKEIIYDKH